MTADACDPFPHMHRGRCYRAGVKAGEAGLRQAIEALADEWDALADWVNDPDSTADQRARSRAGVIAADQLRRVLDDHQEQS